MLIGWSVARAAFQKLLWPASSSKKKERNVDGLGQIKVSDEPRIKSLKVALSPILEHRNFFGEALFRKTEKPRCSACHFEAVNEILCCF